MRLSEISANQARFLQELRTARDALTVGSVDVNSGVQSASDIEAVLDNPPSEQVDWAPFYEKAAKYD